MVRTQACESTRKIATQPPIILCDHRAMDLSTMVDLSKVKFGSGSYQQSKKYIWDKLSYHFRSSPSPSSSSSVSFFGTSLCTFICTSHCISFTISSHFFHYAFLNRLPGIHLSQRRSGCSLCRQGPRQPPHQTILREQRFRSLLLGRL